MSAPSADTTSRRHRLLLIAAFAAVYLIWGSTYLGIRFAVETLPPFLMGGTRFLVGGVLMFVAARVLGAPAPTRRQWRNAALIGVLLISVANGGVTWVEQTTASSVVALLVTVTPLWIVLMEWARPGGKGPSAAAAFGLVAGFGGVSLIVLQGGSGLNGGITPMGVMVLFVASIAWASGAVWSRHLERPSSSVLLVGMQMSSGGLVMLLFALATGEASQFEASQLSMRSILAWCYLLVFGSVVGFTAYSWLLQVTTPDRVATHVFINPVVAVVLGVTLGREALSGGMLAGAVLVVLSVVLILRKPALQPEAPVPIETNEALAPGRTACS